MLQTGHVIEIVTKLYLVVQNATGRAPNVNVGTEFEANFGDEGVTFTFRAITNSASDGGQVSCGPRYYRIEFCFNFLIMYLNSSKYSKFHPR